MAIKTSVVRITGGNLSGRKLFFPSGLCHPMGDRERLALFNSLAHNFSLENACILDLFAGSGALGIEALSRGATRATFVEKNHTLTHALEKNLQTLGAIDRATVLTKKVSSALAELTDANFDLVFADPPYDHLQPDFLMDIAKILAPNGIFILSNPVGANPEAPELSLVDSRTYAGCQLDFYQAI